MFGGAEWPRASQGITRASATSSAARQGTAPAGHPAASHIRKNRPTIGASGAIGSPVSVSSGEDTHVRQARSIPHAFVSAVCL